MVRPSIPGSICAGSRVGSGYAALGAVIVADRVVEPFRQGSGTFVHGYTYSGLPASCFVGLQVLDYVRDHDLFRGPRSGERGVLVRLGMPGANYGKGGDHLQISPPYVISEAQIDQVVEVLDDVLTATPSG